MKFCTRNSCVITRLIIITFFLFSNDVQFVTAEESGIQHNNDWGPDPNSFPKLIVEGENTENGTFEIHGRRIVNIAHVMKEMKTIGEHPLYCTMGGYKLVSETRNGVACSWHYYCDNCERKYIVTSEPHGSLEVVNSALVWGTVAVGNGYSQTEEFLSVLDVPMMSGRKFRKHENKIEEVCMTIMHNVDCENFVSGYLYKRPTIILYIL